MRAQDLGIARVAPAADRVGDADRTRHRLVGGDDQPRRTPAAHADDCNRARGIERERAAEQRVRGSRVADRLVDGGRRWRAHARAFRDHGAETAVGIGERPRAHLERSQLVDDLVDRREKHLFSEQAGIVEIARVALAVAAVAVEQRPRARDARTDRRVSARGAEHERNRAGSAAGLEARAETRAERVRRDDEHEASGTGGDRVGARRERVDSGVRRTGTQEPADGRGAAERPREKRQARALRERRPGRPPHDGVQLATNESGGSDRP